MSVEIKICGLTDGAAIDAAAAGADLVGFVFYPPSPRAVTPDQARELAARLPATVRRVGLFVDPDDAAIAAVLDRLDLDLLQLHGSESPARVAAIKARFGLPVMKALKIATAADLDQAKAYSGVADRLIFDAKPPKTLADALPGGNGVAFDWHLLGSFAGADWMLSGGLTVDNVGDAIRIAHATAVDVSSGVETAPGRKDPALIRKFVEQVRNADGSARR
ncbi:phosphoribosylanthranilate isomerase [Oceanibacterium hippocampi]|uniref:N-(5'-phosphoribosyl)anthranilate isomerase n=1 Tax=Oceanibacterium hippocampi TaxID=745714 RepID=A0A1Y5RPK0_9PROT|nr:phosphoribosylanthranilate isomerase [Oceanibacterium hippocampi]SLN22356.1 N-(5'-phosphoribosyl)anthranilate isomerase [Oceanibacterium hippocampi]